MTRPTRALIDLAALRHNLQRARASAPGARVLAVVKADAYGHGVRDVVGALDAADGFAVASVEEAAVVRELVPGRRVLVLEGFMDEEERLTAARLDLDVVVHHDWQVELLERSPAPPLSVWLKVDTGMHRLGVAPERLPELWDRLAGLPALQGPPRLMTHLANADDLADTRTADQLSLAARCFSPYETETSMANSAGVLGWPAARGDWVRPGIMLYGVSPFAEDSQRDVDLRPVMTLESRLIAVNPLSAGDQVGYGGTWTCPEPMVLGVAAVGYGDGYPRHAPSGTPVLVNGREAPLVGRVSMDMITVDLRGQPEAQVGAPVVLWGRGLPVERIAHHAGTIGYELVCQVTPRVPRVVVAG